MLHLNLKNDKVMQLEPNIANPGQIESMWEEIEPLMQRSIDNTPAGMLTVDVIFELLIHNQAALMYTSRGSKIVMALVVQKVHYSTYCVARVIALAGTELSSAYSFLDVLAAWCLTMGCVEIEAWCSPALARFHRRAGFKHKTTIVSLDLRGKLQ